MKRAVVGVIFSLGGTDGCEDDEGEEIKEKVDDDNDNDNIIKYNKSY